MKYIVSYLQNHYEHWINGFELCETMIEAEKCCDFHAHYHLGKTIHKDAVIGIVLSIEEYQKLLPRQVTESDIQNGYAFIQWLEQQAQIKKSNDTV